jgi:hypothetical protein
MQLSFAKAWHALAKQKKFAHSRSSVTASREHVGASESMAHEESIGVIDR